MNAETARAIIHDPAAAEVDRAAAERFAIVEAPVENWLAVARTVEGRHVRAALQLLALEAPDRLDELRAHATAVAVDSAQPRELRAAALVVLVLAPPSVESVYADALRVLDALHNNNDCN